jgi:hypothetical protein
MENLATLKTLTFEKQLSRDRYTGYEIEGFHEATIKDLKEIWKVNSPNSKMYHKISFVSRVEMTRTAEANRPKSVEQDHIFSLPAREDRQNYAM